MIKEEVIQRSPLRILDKATHGGLGKGNIGIISAKTGTGKVACLVHIATDKLFKGQHVIHLSFNKKVDHIIDWYEDIFKEISNKRELEKAMEVHDEIIHNRVIMNFNQKGCSVEHVLSSLTAMMEVGHFKCDIIAVDGYDFAEVTKDDIKLFKDFAKLHDIEMWFTDEYTTTESFRGGGLPSNVVPVVDDISVILTMVNEESSTHLNLLKDHDYSGTEKLTLQLDPKTLLISNI